MALEFEVASGIDIRKFETLAGLAAAVIAPSAANLTLDGLPCKTLTITVETGEVRWRCDGGTPGAAEGEGHLVTGPESFAIGNPGNVNRLQFYVVADTKIAISFGF